MSHTSSTLPDFETWAQRWREHFEVQAQQALPAADNPNAELALLAQAMRYAVLDGGKRVRALLVYAAGALTNAHPANLDKAALAVEYVHAYSLIHDDMPCMDNDVLRRGKPTVHVRYGEALAMLAGDALQPEAFSVLCSTEVDDAVKAALVSELSNASGVAGMCGGQAVDLLNVGRAMDLEALRCMHAMKTGALMRAAVRMGALCGTPELARAVMPRLDAYAQAMGLAFQVIDDILDVTADSATLGKTAGKDEANDKPTYVSVLGLEKARELAQECLSRARGALTSLEEEGLVEPAGTLRLAQMADYVIGRNC